MTARSHESFIGSEKYVHRNGGWCKDMKGCVDGLCVLSTSSARSAYAYQKRIDFDFSSEVAS